MSSNLVLDPNIPPIMLEWIKSYIDKGNFVGGIFIDLQKAFRGNSHLLIKSFFISQKTICFY